VWSYAAAAPLLLAAGEAPNPLDPYQSLINVGIIGVLVVLIVTKTGFVPKWVLDDAERRAVQDATDAQAQHDRVVSLLQAQIDQLKHDRSELKAANDQITRVTQDQFLPALIEANRLTALYVETLARRGGGQS
jgi:hypothetical protein